MAQRPLVVVDSSVVIASADPSDRHFDACSEALRARATVHWVLPTSVLAESLVVPSRQGAEAVETVRDALRSIFGEVRILDDDVAVASARLRAAHRWLRLPDAFVLAVAEVEQADEVLTCDRRWAGVSERVTVVNSGDRAR